MVNHFIYTSNRSVYLQSVHTCNKDIQLDLYTLYTKAHQLVYTHVTFFAFLHSIYITLKYM